MREEGKGLVLLLNKWDEVTLDWEEYRRAMTISLGQMGDTIMLPVSAKTGQNCLKIFDRIERLERALGATIATAELNRIVGEATAAHNMPAHKGRPVKIYYATQVATHPPTFAVFSNFPSAVPYTYRRYLINRFRDAIGAEGVPVRVVCRKK